MRWRRQRNSRKKEVCRGRGGGNETENCAGKEVGTFQNCFNRLSTGKHLVTVITTITTTTHIPLVQLQ